MQLVSLVIISLVIVLLLLVTLLYLLDLALDMVLMEIIILYEYAKCKEKYYVYFCACEFICQGKYSVRFFSIFQLILGMRKIMCI